MLYHRHLSKYTDYCGPQNPKDKSCYCINLIKDLEDDLGSTFVKGSEICIKYSAAYDVFYFHRENNEPAIISPTGSKYWMVDGSFHRTNGPSVIFSEEDKVRLNTANNTSTWGYKRTPFGLSEESYWMKVLDEADARP